MRNLSGCLFGTFSLLTVGNVIAQPVATDFRTPVWPVDQSKNGYNNNANPFLALYKGKYHLGEDWNGNEGGNTDYGDLVYPTAVGKVVKALDQKGSVGKVVVVKHLLPDGQAVYSYYFHLSQILASLNQIVYPNKPLGKIGDANGYYAGAAHLHFELRRVNEPTPTNLGYGKTISMAMARKYFDPSLFIDDRATKISMNLRAGKLFVASDEGIEIPDYTPAALSYVICRGQTKSLFSAVAAGWIDSAIYVDERGAAIEWLDLVGNMVFGPDVDFQIKPLQDCSLTIVVSGNNFQDSRARDDMIRMASRAGFIRVKMETLKDLGNDTSSAFDLHSLCFDRGTNTGVGCALHATNRDIPLSRWIRWYEPTTNKYIGEDWSPLDPNDID